jgi:hypothetical protein
LIQQVVAEIRRFQLIPADFGSQIAVSQQPRIGPICAANKHKKTGIQGHLKQFSKFYEGVME